MSIIEGEYNYEDEDRRFGNTYCKPHGVFVGDAFGPDYMCHFCEMGMDTWVERDTYEMMFSFGDGLGMTVDNIDGWDGDDLAERWAHIELWLTRKVDGHVMWSHPDTLSLKPTFWAIKTSSGYWSE